MGLMGHPVLLDHMDLLDPQEIGITGLFKIINYRPIMNKNQLKEISTFAMKKFFFNCFTLIKMKYVILKITSLHEKNLS